MPPTILGSQFGVVVMLGRDTKIVAHKESEETAPIITLAAASKLPAQSESAPRNNGSNHLFAKQA
jgi:hypothetical protein